MDALAFLGKSGGSKQQSIYVLHGDEDFLKRMCRERIQSIVLGDSDPAFALSSYPGEKLAFATVRNDLETVAFLSPVRLVVVEAADPFITENREALEKYADKPSPIGVLVLEAKSFPETTKLAKKATIAKVSCKSPSGDSLIEWCIDWCKTQHGKTLELDAAGMLANLVGSSLGILSTELDKIAAFAGTRPRITVEDVNALVGRSREANFFKMMDAIGDGKPQAAISILTEVFDEGVVPLAVLGMLTAQLKKLAAVDRQIGLGLTLGPAMDAAGIPKWPQAREATTKQLKHLGRRRLSSLIDRLVEVNAGVKGGCPLPERIQVERLITRLAMPRE